MNGTIRYAILLATGLLALTVAAGCRMQVAFGPVRKPEETAEPAASLAAAERTRQSTPRPLVTDSRVTDSRVTIALENPAPQTGSKVRSTVKGRSFKTVIAARGRSESRPLPLDGRTSTSASTSTSTSAQSSTSASARARTHSTPLAENSLKLTRHVNRKHNVKKAGHVQPPELFAPPIIVDDHSAAEIVPPAPGVRPELKSSPSEKPSEETPKGKGTQIPQLPTTNVGKLSLPEVLQMAGAQSWIVMLAHERIHEAYAKYEAARVMWVPSLNIGVGYTKHDGRIQDTGGKVIDVSRNSLFVGGGAVSSNAAIAGGGGGPARMFVDLSLADAIFQPRSALSLVEASRAGHHATFNDTLLAASLSYYDVVFAQLQEKLALENLAQTKELLVLTQAFQRSGKGTLADVSRVEVEFDRRNQEIVDAQLAAQIASAELARLLRLDVESVPDSIVITADAKDILAIDFTSTETPLSELVSEAVKSRPEITENSYRMQAAKQNVQAERWRPWIPNLHMGASAGGFGGGLGSSLTGLDGRVDVDLLAVWQVKNLGLGTAAARKRVRSRHEQAQFQFYRQRDRVIAEVTKAYARVRAQHRRVEISRSREKKARQAHRDSMRRIKGLQGIPLEALQSLRAFVEARQESLNAAVAHNRAQLTLLRAVGRTAKKE